MRAARVHGFSADMPLSGLSVDDVSEPDVPDGWASVEVRAAALNAHDLWSLRGVGLTRHDLPRILGSDAAGRDSETGRDVVVYPVVAAAPPQTTEALDPGQSPLLSERYDGTLAERVVVPRHNLLAKPAHLSFTQAATLPTAWLTAYRMLYVLGRAQPGDTVLVQGATGGVSTALVMLASRTGIRTWVTGRTEEGRTWASQCGADLALAPGARVPERVDVVLETVGAATWAHSLRCVRVGGRIVVAGATSGGGPVEELQRIFFHQISVIGARMGTLNEMTSLLALVDRERITPPVDSQWALDEAPAAFERLQRGQLAGKVVLIPPDGR